MYPDVLPSSAVAQTATPAVDIPLNLMKMALALLDKESRSDTITSCHLQEAIEARTADRETLKEPAMADLTANETDWIKVTARALLAIRVATHAQPDADQVRDIHQLADALQKAGAAQERRLTSALR